MSCPCASDCRISRESARIWRDWISALGVWSNTVCATSQLPFFFFFFLVQIQSGCIISYLCLVRCGGSPSAEGALGLVQLGPSVQMQREWEKGIAFVAKKTCKTRSSIYHCRNLNHYCAKREERTSLLACNRTWHHISLVSFSSPSVPDVKAKARWSLSLPSCCSGPICCPGFIVLLQQTLGEMHSVVIFSGSCLLPTGPRVLCVLVGCGPRLWLQTLAGCLVSSETP